MDGRADTVTDSFFPRAEALQEKVWVRCGELDGSDSSFSQLDHVMRTDLPVHYDTDVVPIACAHLVPRMCMEYYPYLHAESVIIGALHTASSFSELIALRG